MRFGSGLRYGRELLDVIDPVHVAEFSDPIHLVGRCILTSTPFGRSSGDESRDGREPHMFGVRGLSVFLASKVHSVNRWEK